MPGVPQAAVREAGLPVRSHEEDIEPCWGTSAIKKTQMCLRASTHLQRHVTALGGYTLQGLVVAEASAAFDHHTGRDVRVLRVLRVLLENVHQGLPGLAHALDVNFVEGENYKNKRSNGL